MGGLTQLQPHVSNHGMPLVYFSRKRENVLVYLSNAVEKYAKETGFLYHGRWEKWAPYGFEKSGVIRLEEYYPNALERTYRGVSGYIYRVDCIVDAGIDLQIPNAAASRAPAAITGAEFVPDAYEAIMQAEQSGLISVARYTDLTDQKKDWIKRTVIEEYDAAEEHPEYRHFLKGVFSDLSFEEK